MRKLRLLAVIDRTRKSPLRPRFCEMIFLSTGASAPLTMRRGDNL